MAVVEMNLDKAQRANQSFVSKVKIWIFLREDSLGKSISSETNYNK